MSKLKQKNKQKPSKEKVQKDKTNSLGYWKKKVKSCNLPIYKILGKKMNDPLVLINSIIDYYHWLFKSTDFYNINLTDQRNRCYLDLFVFAFTSSKEIASDFLNYYLFSIHTAYDQTNKEWDIEALKSIIVSNKRRLDYDLFAMYVLISANFDLLVDYFAVIQINNKLNLSFNAIEQLFMITVNQEFFNELKLAVLNDKTQKNKLKQKHYFANSRN